MDKFLKSNSQSQYLFNKRHASPIKVPSSTKASRTFMVTFKQTELKPSKNSLIKENLKLKQQIQLLKLSLKKSEEALTAASENQFQLEYYSTLTAKLKFMEKNLLEAESNCQSLQQKLFKLQQNLNTTSKERDSFKEQKEQNEVLSEQYRIMKLKSIELVMSLFAENPPKVFSMRYMELDQSFLPTLSSILKKYPSIEVLDLEGNLLNDSGAKQLAEIFSVTEGNLNEVNLSSNKITASGGWALIQSIKTREDTKFKKIKKLKLSQNLFEKHSEIYVKAWESFKLTKEGFPNRKSQINELRRVSDNTAGKLFASAAGNVKEIQDFIDIIDKVLVNDPNVARNEFDEKMPGRQEPNKKRKAEENHSKGLVETQTVSLEIEKLYSRKGEIIPGCIEKLLENGLHVDEIDQAKDETLLMHAARIGSLRLVKLMLSKKANLDIKNTFGENAFLVACKHSNFEVASFLVQCGSKLNSRDRKGAKAIHHATKNQNHDSICRLTEMGLDVNSADHHKKTPLHYAARIGDIETANLLIQLGAELNKIDHKGRTAAGLAEDKENFEFTDFLEKIGGKKINGFGKERENEDGIGFGSIKRISGEIMKDLKEADKNFKKMF